MIPYGRQTIEEDDIAAVTDVLRSDRLTQGPAVEAFERALAEYCGVADVVTFSSGTTALQAAYAAAGVKPGDEFITSPLTFCATANAGIWQGATPVFADIDPQTGNLDPASLAQAITPRTKVLVPVDYAGHPADLTQINDVARTHGLTVIEDACHALGASVRGKRVGSLADLTVFSFHPVKPITTGEGGAVATAHPEFARRLRQFRSHGIVQDRDPLEHPIREVWYQEMQERGLNGRLTDIQCALGLSQLKKLDRFIEARRKIAVRYTDALADFDLELPTEQEGFTSGWHLYPVRIRHGRRARVFSALRSAGIGVQVHYLPVYFHPYYARLGYQRGICPQAEAFFESVISLPIYPSLRVQDQEKIVSELTRALTLPL